MSLNEWERVRKFTFSLIVVCWKRVRRGRESFFSLLLEFLESKKSYSNSTSWVRLKLPGLASSTSFLPPTLHSPSLQDGVPSHDGWIWMFNFQQPFKLSVETTTNWSFLTPPTLYVQQPSQCNYHEIHDSQLGSIEQSRSRTVLPTATATRDGNGNGRHEERIRECS